MALEDSTLSNLDTVDYNNKNVKVKDDYDYAAENVPLTYLRGLIKITSPAKVILHDDTDWDNPTIDHDVSLESAWKTLINSLDADTQVILPGDYAFVYQLGFFDMTGVSFGTTSMIVVDGDVTSVMLPGNIITIAGALTPANDGSYTIASSSYNGSETEITITVSTLTVELDPGFTANVDNNVLTKSYSLCYDFDLPTLDIDVSHNCNYPKLTVEDNTNRGDGTLLTRTTVVTYPIGADGNPVDTAHTDTSIANDKFEVRPLWTKNYSIGHTSTNSEVLTSGMVVLYTLLGTEIHTVTCKSGLLYMKDCLTKLFNRYKADCACKGSSPLACTVQQIDNLYKLMVIAQEAGEEDDLDALSNEMQALIEAEGVDACGCDEADDVPVKVDGAVLSLYLEAQDVVFEPTIELLSTDVQAAIEEVYEKQKNVYLLDVKKTIQPSDKPTFVVPADTMVENYDGFEATFYVANTTGAATVGIEVGGTPYAAISVGSMTYAKCRIWVYKNGSNLTIGSEGGDGSSWDEASIAIIGFDFTVDQTFQVKFATGTLSTIGGLIVKKMREI